MRSTTFKSPFLRKPWITPEHYKWMIFIVGAFAGFALTVLVNIASKLLITALALFGAGILVGRLWRRS